MKNKIILAIALLLLIPLVYADIGPHSAVRLDFYVTYNNTLITENFNAGIVACGQAGNCSWEKDNAALCKNSVCTFTYYRIERVPSQMKLLVDLNGKNFSSDAINFSWKKPILFYNISIMPSDKVIITPTPEPEQEYPSSLLLWLPFIGALLLTIAIELIILIIFLKKWKVKAGKWRRPILTVAIADIISVPLVWMIFLCLVAVLAAFFQAWSLLIAIIIAEGFAAVFEAYAIFFFNKKMLPMKRAFWLSIAMNAASFVLGDILLTGLLSIIFQA